MARAVEHLIPRSTTKRTLVIAEDPWLRFRLERELEQAGCKVVTLARLRPDELSEPALYDVVLTDAALFPEGSRLEALRALRRGSPDARFVLLVGPDERGMAEQARQSGFDLVLERPTRAQALAELVREALAEARPAVEGVPVPVQFQFLLPQFTGTGKRRVGTTFTSLMIHMAMLLVMLVIPLMVTETLDIRELTQTWLVAPPPPPPPPPPAPATALVRRVRPVLQTPTGKLVAPTVIPKEIARIVEASVDLENIGGVPGGVAGGQLGGVIGGVLGSIPVPRPVPVTPPKPVRVGGNVRPPRLLQRVEPLYPPLARQARLQGEVRIDAVIDATGHVVEMKVLSGHPLLARAAMEAVQQWVYEPTYLNEQPVAVVLELTVYFKLQ